MCKFINLTIGQAYNFSVSKYPLHKQCGQINYNAGGIGIYRGHREDEGYMADVIEYTGGQKCSSCGAGMVEWHVPCENYTLEIPLKLEMPEELCWSTAPEEVEIEWSKPWKEIKPEEIKIV